MSTDATNREAAIALAEALGNLPLALEQAAAYAAQTGISLADYLSLFRERAAAHVPNASPSADYPPALAVTFEIAFARLREESPASADLLTLCAFLAPDDVPLEIFSEGIAAGMVTDAPAAAATLQAYALAKVRGESFLSMHRLTQAIARDRLGDDERKKWAETAVTLMEAAFPFNMEDTRTWAPSTRFLQHALDAAGHAKVLGVAGESASILLNNVGAYLLNNAEVAKAKAAFEKSNEICEGLFGPSHPQLAIGLNNIGETFRRQGRLAEATDYLKRALAIDREALGPEHPSVAIRLNNIGGVLDEEGDHDEAREYYKRALSIFEAAYGPTHAYIAGTLNNIGTSLHDQGDMNGACAYHKRALPIYEEAYGPNHPNVAINLNNLGTALGKLGDVIAARRYFERALRIFREHLDEKHPLILTVKLNLAELASTPQTTPRRRKKPRRRRK
jgi:tetratricopeptide (TPR) repeat protein